MGIDLNSPEVKLTLSNLYGVDANQLKIEGTQFSNLYKVVLPDGTETLLRINVLGDKYELRVIDAHKTVGDKIYIRNDLINRWVYYYPQQNKVNIVDVQHSKDYSQTTVIERSYNIKKEEQKITDEDLKNIVQDYLRQQLNNQDLKVTNLYISYTKDAQGNIKGPYEIHVRTSDGRDYVLYTDKDPYSLTKRYSLSLELESVRGTYHYPRDVVEKTGTHKTTVEAKDINLMLNLLESNIREGYREYEKALVKDALNKLKQDNPEVYDYFSKNLRNYTIEEFNKLVEKWNKEILPQKEREAVQSYLDQLKQQNPNAYDYISSRLQNHTIEELNKLIEEYNKEYIKYARGFQVIHGEMLKYDEKKLLDLNKEQRLQKWEEMWEGKDLSNPGYRFQYELGKAIFGSNSFNWLDTKIASLFGKTVDTLKDITGYKTIENWKNEITALYKIGKISEEEYRWWEKEFAKMEREAFMKGALLFTVPVAFAAPEVALTMITAELAGTTAYKKVIDTTGSKELAALADLATQLAVGYGIFKNFEALEEWSRTSTLNRYSDIKVNRLSITELEQKGKYSFFGDTEIKLGDGRYVQAKILGTGDRLELVPIDNPEQAITVRINPKALRDLKELTEKVMSGKASPEEIKRFLESYFEIKKGLNRIKDASYFDVQAGLTRYKISYLDDLGEGFEFRIITKPELLKAYKTKDLSALPELRDLTIFKIDGPDDIPKILNEQIAIVRTEDGEVLNLIKLGSVDAEGFVSYFDLVSGRIVKVPVQIEDIASKFKQEILVRTLGKNTYYIQVGDLSGYTVKLGKLKDGTKVWEIEMIDPRTGKHLGSKIIPVEKTNELLDFIANQPTILNEYKIIPKKEWIDKQKLIGFAKESPIVSEPLTKLPLAVREPLKIEVKGDKAYVSTNSLGIIAEIPRSVVDDISEKGKIDPYDVDKLAKYIKDKLNIDISILDRLDIKFDKVIINDENKRSIIPVSSNAKSIVNLFNQSPEKKLKQPQNLEQLEGQTQGLGKLEPQSEIELQLEEQLQKQKLKQLEEQDIEFPELKFDIPKIPRIPKIKPPDLISSETKKSRTTRSKEQETKREGARGRLKTRFFL